MAVTGSGTQQDPYLVNTYADIAEAFALRSTGSGTKYVKLMSNIDGGWGQWTPINVSSGLNAIDFDLNEHEIVNFYAESGMFFMKAGADIFRNGAIYNIVSEELETSFISGVKFYYMSLSSKIKRLASECALDENEYNMCATRLDIDELNGPSSGTPSIVKFADPSLLDPDSSKKSVVSDWLINIKNCNVSELEIFTVGSGQIVAENNRVQGKITNITGATITNYPAISSSDVAFENATLNYEMPAYSGTVSSGFATTIIGTGTTGVINSSLIHESTYASYTMLNLIPVTNTEMLSADTLTQKGFTVYDITPDA